MSVAAPLIWPALPDRHRRYTEAEYLDFDAKAEGRWEYIDGYIMPVGQPNLVNQLDPTFRAGTTPAHYELSRTLSGLLFGRLPKECKAFTSDARVHIPLTRGFVYPDIVVVCGKLEFANPEVSLPSLSNPVVVIEILSDSTAEHDRIGKFMRYRSVESLQHYLLVDSRRVMVELFTRSASDWKYELAIRPEDVIALTAVNCTLLVSELYGGLDLPVADDITPFSSSHAAPPPLPG